MMARHAYLITAYDDFYTLSRLVRLLDDPRNGIYVHIDRKSPTFSEAAFLSDNGTGRLVLAPRRRVDWGDYSQVESVLALIKLAMRSGKYDYFHLLSGSDLPLKSQAYIHGFCDEHRGKEFVSFHQMDGQADWVRYAYWFNALVKTRSPALSFAEKLLRHGSLRLQRAVNVDRRKRFDGQIRYGSDWYSITHDLAQLLLDGEATIARVFKRAFIPSEFYVQTILWNSHLRDNALNGGSRSSNMRLIDWDRGTGSSPYVMRSRDFDQLSTSKMLFARKFDSRIDRGVVDRVYEHVAAQP